MTHAEVNVQKFPFVVFVSEAGLPTHFLACGGLSVNRLW